MSAARGESAPSNRGSGNSKPAFLNRATAERVWKPASIRSRAFLVAGSDSIALLDLRKELIRRFAGESASDLSRTDFDAASDPPGLLHDALREISLFGGCHVIVVERAEKLFDAVKFGNLAPSFESLDDRTLVILHSEVSARDLTGKPLVDHLVALQAAAYCYAPFDEAAGIQWVSEFCVRRGRTITRDAASKVVERAGIEPGELASEIEKLIFAVEGDDIDLANVEKLLSDHRERESFDWADAVMNGERRAIAMVGRVLRGPRDAAGMVGAIQSRLDDVERLASGAFLLFPMKRAAEKVARKWGSDRIAAARETLLAVDLALKSHPDDQAAARLEIATVHLLEE